MNEKDEKQMIEELHNMLEEVFDAEKQMELYCKVMKDFFLSGSTNN